MSRHEKAPIVAAIEASGNEINFGEEIVMTNHSTAVSSVIPVIQGNVFDHRVHLVDAQALHQFLGIAARFNDWIKRRIAEYGFIEGEDFYSSLSKSTGGRPSRAYSITLDMGKELAMVERNEKGRQARRYFIECEKRLREVSPQDASTILAQTIGTDGFHMLASLIKGKVARLPAPAQRSAKAKIWAQTHVAFGVRSAADIPADKLDAARNFIAAYTIEGEYIEAAPERSLTLDQNETHHLYLLMSGFASMHRHKQNMLDAARALGSNTLMTIFDQLNQNGGSFQVLDRRRMEIYGAYSAYGSEGGYAMRGVL